MSIGVGRFLAMGINTAGVYAQMRLSVFTILIINRRITVSVALLSTESGQKSYTLTTSEKSTDSPVQKSHRR